MEASLDSLRILLWSDTQKIAYAFCIIASYLADHAPVSELWNKLSARGKNWAAFAATLVFPAVLWLLECQGNVPLGFDGCAAPGWFLAIQLVVGGIANWVLVTKLWHQYINRAIERSKSKP